MASETVGIFFFFLNFLGSDGLVAVSDVAAVALSVGVDQFLGVGALGSLLDPAVVVVAVLTHALGVIGPVGVGAADHLTFLSGELGCPHIFQRLSYFLS